MSNDDDNVCIHLYDLNNFNGYFNPPNEKLFYSNKIFPIGVYFNHQDNKYTAIAENLDEYIIFEESEEGLAYFQSFLLKSIPKGMAGIICLDNKLFEYIMGYKASIYDYLPLTLSLEKPEILEHLESDGIYMGFKPISSDFVFSYLKTVCGVIPSPLELSLFIRLIPYDSLTYNFLSLNGLIFSAQDIIKFIQSNNLIDMVFADFGAGAELFTLSKSEETNKNIDTTRFSLDYFKEIKINKNLPDAYKFKVAALSTFKKNGIRLGYRVLWNDSNQKEEK